MLGIDLYDFFHIVNEPTILKPTTTINKPYSLDLYQGCYHECKHNIKLGSFTLPYKEVWNISTSINDTHCTILLDDVVISIFKLADLTDHTKQYLLDKETDIQWYNLRHAKNEYESYINEHKSTLYDEQVKYSIEQLVPGYPTYTRLIAKFERAEQLCHLDDVTKNEYELALKEIDSFISPIMQNIVISNSDVPN